LAFINRPAHTSWRLRAVFAGSLTRIVRLSLYTNYPTVSEIVNLRAWADGAPF